jgi:hypothetical protein
MKPTLHMIEYGVVSGVGWNKICTLSQFYNPSLIVSFSLQLTVFRYVVGFLLRRYCVFKA